MLPSHELLCCEYLQPGLQCSQQQAFHCANNLQCHRVVSLHDMGLTFRFCRDIPRYFGVPRWLTNQDMFCVLLCMGYTFHRSCHFYAATGVTGVTGVTNSDQSLAPALKNRAFEH